MRSRISNIDLIDLAEFYEARSPPRSFTAKMAAYLRRRRGAPGGSSFERSTTFRANLNATGQRFLSQALTINGITVQPTALWTADNAAGDTLTATIGEDLIENGAGALVLDRGSPLGIGGGADTSIQSDGTNYLETASDSVIDWGTDDVVVEMVFKINAAGVVVICGKESGGVVGEIQLSTLQLVCRLDDGPNLAVIASAVLVIDVFYHAALVLDRSGFAQWHINGKVNGSAVDISSVGDVHATGPFAVFARAGGTLPSQITLGYLAMWQRPAWADSHLQAAVMQERFNKAVGVYPQLARGTSLPTVVTRSTSAFLRKDAEVFPVGPDWPRVEQIDDAAADQMRGYYSEDDGLNRLWPFKTVGDGYSVAGTPTNTPNDAVAPNRETQAALLGVGASTDYLWRAFTGFTNDGVIGPSIWFKRKSTAGVFTIAHADSQALGRWNIDLTQSALDTWQLIDRSSPYISVANEFTASATGGGGYWFFSDSDAPLREAWLWGQHQENGPASGLAGSGADTTTAPASKISDTLTYKGDDGNLDRDGVGSKQQASVACNVLISSHDTPGTVPVTAWALSDGGASTERIYMFASSGDVALFRAVQATEQWQVVGTTDITDGLITRLEGKYAINDARLLVDGTAEGTPDTSGTPSDNLDKISVASDNADAFNLRGRINNFEIKEKI